MGATLIDVQLSDNLAPGAFVDAERSNVDWDRLITDPLTPRTATLFGGVQKWKVARVHLVERLGELFRCEVILTRIEGFPDDPSIARPGKGWFDRLADRFDDQNAGDTLPGSSQKDDLTSATDALRGARLLDTTSGPPLPFGMGPTPQVGDLPGKIGDVFQSFGDIANDQFNDPPKSIDDLLGIERSQWNPEIAPSPGTFLDKFRSVLIRRLGTGGTAPLHGRWVSGLITEYEDLGVFGTNRRAIRIVIEPQLARLSLRRNHRIFQGLDAIAIVREIFGEAKVYEQNFVAPSGLTARPYCIQYGETDLELVLRLFSEEGLIPVFDHHYGAERLTLVTPEDLSLGQGVHEPQTLDANDLLRDGISGDSDPGGSAIDERLWSFNLRRSVRPTNVSVRSTNFSTYQGIPSHAQQGADTEDAKIDAFFTQSTKAEPSFHEFPARSVLDFHEDTATQEDLVPINREAELDLYALRSSAVRGRGTTNAVALSAGQRVNVSDAMGRDADLYDREVVPFGRDFLLTAIEALVETGDDALGPNPTLWYLPLRPRAFSATDPITFLSYVEAVPHDQIFVPPRRRAPKVEGVQTAITKQSPTKWTEGMSRVGVDVIGRVRARMHWDRRPDPLPTTNEQPLSPPIRIASTWAGYGWGTTFLPREGMELLVAFEHGDPTRPIALGMVHGAVNRAPCDRPHIPLYDDGGPGKHHPTNDKVRKDKVLHYQKDHTPKPSGTQHINMIRTQVDPPGQADRKLGYHEVSFDDTPSRERVRVHSEGILQKDVVHDHRTLAVQDQMNIVQDEQKEVVEQGDQKLFVHGTRTKEVIGHERLEVGGKQDLHVTGTSILEVKGHLAREIGTDETMEVGRPDPGMTRTIEIDKGRRTEVEGNDVRVVKGMVKEDIGGTYELSGAPLAMKQTAPAGAPAKGITASENGDLTFDAGEGKADIIAEGDVTIRTGGLHLWGKTSVRFEAGDEVWLEVSAEGVKMFAPEGVDMYCITSDGSSSGVISLINPEIDGKRWGEITMKLDAGTQDDRGHYQAVLRAGEKGGERMDPLEGAPGWKINTDTMEIKGGYAALKAPIVEIQNGEGAKTTHRTLTDEEKQTREDLAAKRKEVEEQERVAAKAVEDRDKARERYLAASKKRQEVQAKIESTTGKDSDLSEAIADVEAAERELEKKRAAENAACEEHTRAVNAGEDPSDAKDTWEAATEDREEAEDNLKEAKEDLDDEREEHGALVKEYEDANREEESASQALTSAQDKVVYEEQKLRRLQSELRALEAKAQQLQLPPEEEAPAPEEKAAE